MARISLTGLSQRLKNKLWKHLEDGRSPSVMEMPGAITLRPVFEVRQATVRIER